jgi:hypothetical protein
MSKPDFSGEMESLADRSKRLRALVADQKQEESGRPKRMTKDVTQQSSALAAVFVRPKAAHETHHDHATPSTVNSSDDLNLRTKPLDKQVEQVIQSDNPSRLSHDTYQWSRRLAYLSTRIPEDMRNLIDDLLFILKKEAKKDLSDEPTLQDLAREAWADLLQKHKDLFARYDVRTGGVSLQ